MKKIITIMAVFAIFSVFTDSVSAETERESIMNETHTLSWAYFTGDYDRWYISPTFRNSSLGGNVYSLTPIKDHKAGWATVGEGVATIDLEDNIISVEDNLDSDPSDWYYDLGWDELVQDDSIHLDRQWIQGKTVSVKWYFFRVESTKVWYIINVPGYGSGTSILKFSEKDGQYDWIETDTKDLEPVFFVENETLYLKFSKAILEDSIEESHNPTLISPMSSGSYETDLETGYNYFKFEVEPGYDYSFIVNTNSYNHLLQSKGAAYSVHYSNSGFQSQVHGIAKPDHGISGNDSPAKSAIMFKADPTYYSKKYYNYVRVVTGADVSDAHIRLVKKYDKQFDHPVNGVHAYYNAFGHRAKIDGGTYLTLNGHDGIDITAYTVDGDVDFKCPIVPVASGEVIKTASLPGNLGKAVWVSHDINGITYTSLYAHLQDLEVSKGESVTKGVTTLGYIHTGERHFHLELFKKYETGWYDGYSSGNGQIDPLAQIFDK